MERRRCAIPIDYNVAKKESEKNRQVLLSSLAEEIVFVEDEVDEISDGAVIGIRGTADELGEIDYGFGTDGPAEIDDGVRTDEPSAANELAEIFDGFGTDEPSSPLGEVDVGAGIEELNAANELGDTSAGVVEFTPNARVEESALASHEKSIVGINAESVPSTSAAVMLQTRDRPSSSSDDDFSKLRIKLEEQILQGRKTIQLLNKRIGIEEIKDDTDDDDHVNITLEEELFSDIDVEKHQYDRGFAHKYGFTTNVS